MASVTDRRLNAKKYLDAQGRPGLKSRGTTLFVIVAVSILAMVQIANSQQPWPGQDADKDLKSMSLKEACPDSERKNDRPGTGSGVESVERARKLVEIMKTCTARLKIAFQDNPDPGSVNQSIEQLIGAAQARVNELLGRGGLVEDVNLYIARLNIQLKDIPRHTQKSDVESQAKETQKLIDEAKKALQGLEGAAKGFNDSVIFLESKRPEIAFKYSLGKSKENVEARREAMALIDQTTAILNDIEKDLRANERWAVSVRPKVVVLDPCGQTLCTLVPVFFGTDRKKTELASRTDFGPERSSTLQLGQAIVTVPRISDRRIGEITRPTWMGRFLGGFSAEGDPTKHFTLHGVHVYPNVDDFLAAVLWHGIQAGEFKDHAFIFVHGYNTSFEYALYRVAQIAYDLAGSDGRPFGTPFLYSWPSGGGWQNYIYDVESAQFSAEYLRRFVELVVDKSGAKQVHLIAHSMGNRPLLAALDEIARSSTRPTAISQIILAAPDMDASQFAQIAARIVPVAKGVTLYASANDYAMKASREAHRGVARAGDVPKSGPVVISGVDTIDVSAISIDIIARGHSDYVDRRELLNDIGLLLRKGERPPHQRAPMLRPVKTERGTFWRVQQ